MTNHNVITLKLSDVYSLSLVQGKAVTNYADSHAELALIRTDDVNDAFVPCNAWCPEWVGEDYFDDVVHERYDKVAASEVLDEPSKSESLPIK